MSELQEVQRAGAEVLTETEQARDRGEIGADTALGIRLVAISMMMKSDYSLGAMRIAEEYAVQRGLDFDLLKSQVDARIYEHVQIARLEGMIGDDDE